MFDKPMTSEGLSSLIKEVYYGDDRLRQMDALIAMQAPEWLQLPEGEDGEKAWTKIRANLVKTMSYDEQDRLYVVLEGRRIYPAENTK